MLFYAKCLADSQEINKFTTVCAQNYLFLKLIILFLRL
jgi:hypothetical protein